MKITIPQDCKLTDKALIALKSETVNLINNYEEKYHGDYKMYLYSNFIKIYHNRHNYIITIVEYKNELFWFVKPFQGSYFLIKKVKKITIDVIITILSSF